MSDLNKIWDNALTFDFNHKKQIGYIYALFNNNEIIYIGQTTNIENRIMAHKHLPNATHCKYIEVPREKMDAWEFKLVHQFLPRLNRSAPVNKEYVPLDEANKINPLAFSNRVGLLRKLREMKVESVDGYFQKSDLEAACKALDEEVR